MKRLQLITAFCWNSLDFGKCSERRELWRSKAKFLSSVNDSSIGVHRCSRAGAVIRAHPGDLKLSFGQHSWITSFALPECEGPRCLVPCDRRCRAPAPLVAVSVAFVIIEDTL